MLFTFTSAGEIYTRKQIKPELLTNSKRTRLLQCSITFDFHKPQNTTYKSRGEKENGVGGGGPKRKNNVESDE